MIQTQTCTGTQEPRDTGYSICVSVRSTERRRICRILCPISTARRRAPCCLVYLHLQALCVCVCIYTNLHSHIHACTYAFVCTPLRSWIRVTVHGRDISHHLLQLLFFFSFFEGPLTTIHVFSTLRVQTMTTYKYG